MIRAARLTSPRLQKVLTLLRDGKPHTTRDVNRRTGVCAVNTCVAELRVHGAEITCRQEVMSNGQRRWFYTMIKEPRSA